jgi:Ca2+-binding EF-hand superfamily protein/mono/diheme cytochrome c family protein
MRHLAMVALTTFLVCLCTTDGIAQQDQSNDEPIGYSEHIQPLFMVNCMRCHKAGSAKGGYAMSEFDSLFVPGKSGNTPIVKGKPEESYLLELITPHDQNGKLAAKMPKQSDPLGQADVDLVSAWISQGASQDTSIPVSTNAGTAGPGANNGSQQAGGNSDNLIRTNPLLRIADLNNDGELSWEELDTISRILHEMDWNRDGQLSADELDFNRAQTNVDREMGTNQPGGNTAAKSGGGATAQPERTYSNETMKQLYTFDRNKDGKLTRSELPGYLRSIMSTADKNNDRLLDEAEIQAYSESVSGDK